MQPKVHTYVSIEPLVKPNAFIVESSEGLVIVDTTLTVTDSTALKHLADRLGKPIAGVLITHGHPDHIAGASIIAPDGKTPIYALQSVHDVIAASEASKHEQWSGLFKEEWIPKWTYPNTIVTDGQTVQLAGMEFRVVDLGAGGDCDANSMWLLETDKSAAFVGDFIYQQQHSYMMDGSVLRWIGNLKRFQPLLSQYQTLYIGHGPATTDSSHIQQQIDYFATACAYILEVTNGSAKLTSEAKKRYEHMMTTAYPDYGFQLTVAYSAEPLAKELLGVKNYDW